MDLLVIVAQGWQILITGINIEKVKKTTTHQPERKKKSMKKCQTNATTVIKWKETDKTKNEFLIYTFFWHERVQNINLIYNTLFLREEKKT